MITLNFDRRPPPNQLCHPNFQKEKVRICSLQTGRMMDILCSVPLEWAYSRRYGGYTKADSTLYELMLRAFPDNEILPISWQKTTEVVSLELIRYGWGLGFE